jgi:hypothetical protein
MSAAIAQNIGRKFLTGRTTSPFVDAKLCTGKLVIVGTAAFAGWVGGTTGRVVGGMTSVGGASSLEASYDADNNDPSARQKLIVSSE